MAGRLSGTVCGRPVEIDASGQDVLVALSGLRAAWQLRRLLPTGVQRLVATAGKRGFTINVRVGRWGTLQLAPDPHRIIRWLMPAWHRG